MADPILTYVEFDDSGPGAKPITKLFYAEWKAANGAAESAFADPKDDETPIPDEVRRAIAKIVWPEGLAAIVAALESASQFLDADMPKAALTKIAAALKLARAAP